jgi:sugar phosphate isomerase/epimerase
VTERPLPTLAFSTLACPEWDAETVVDRAVSIGFGGVEWRGGPDGTVRTDWTARQRLRLRDRLGRAGIASVAVTAYSNLISGDPEIRRASVDAIAAHAELASNLGAPTVRVFLGVRDDDASPDELAIRAVAALEAALAASARWHVDLSIEPHDDHVRSETVLPILDAIGDPAVGVVWDIANAWSAGEDPAVGLRAYEGRIKYVQVKDGTGSGATWRLCGLGAGEVPLIDALAGLAQAASPRGAAIPPVSVEWERAWHPELAPAGVALPATREWLSTALAAVATALPIPAPSAASR